MLSENFRDKIFSSENVLPKIFHLKYLELKLTRTKIKQTTVTTCNQASKNYSRYCDGMCSSNKSRFICPVCFNPNNVHSQPKTATLTCNIIWKIFTIAPNRKNSCHKKYSTANIPQMQKFSLRTNFRGQAMLTKIKPTKIWTHEELATVITMGYFHLRKFIPSKI